MSCMNIYRKLLGLNRSNNGFRSAYVFNCDWIHNYIDYDSAGKQCCCIN
ncbi:unnamed protein product [Tenebrio molitor]|nr:unnamed protein product [Tenebrio molitor]